MIQKNAATTSKFDILNAKNQRNKRIQREIGKEGKGSESLAWFLLERRNK